MAVSLIGLRIRQWQRQWQMGGPRSAKTAADRGYVLWPDSAMHQPCVLGTVVFHIVGMIDCLRLMSNDI